MRRSLGFAVIAVVALIGVTSCGGSKDATAKATTTTITPTTSNPAGNGKCVGKNGKPLGSIEQSNLQAVVNEFNDLSQVPAPIRDPWTTLGNGYRQLLVKIGDVQLSPPPTDPTVLADIRAMTADPTFAAALQKIETYCGLAGH
jgi:hypothetical protein